jgi:hypothetical protein
MKRQARCTSYFVTDPKFFDASWKIYDTAAPWK